jgi:hypothetical protein
VIYKRGGSATTAIVFHKKSEKQTSQNACKFGRLFSYALCGANYILPLTDLPKSYRGLAFIREATSGGGPNFESIHSIPVVDLNH